MKSLATEGPQTPQKTMCFNTASKIHRKLQVLQWFGSTGSVRRPDLKAYACQPGAGQETTFGLWCGKSGPRFSAQTQGTAMLNWGRHNAQRLPVRKEAGPMLSAGCAHVGPSQAHVEPSCAHLGLMLCQVGPMLSHVGPILGQVGPMLSYVGLILGPCWAYVGPMLAYVGPMLAHVEPSWEVCWGHVWAIYVLKMPIFPPRVPSCSPKPRKNKCF